MCESMLPPQFSVTKWYTNHKELPFAIRMPPAHCATDNLIIVKQTDKTNANDTKNCHQVVVLCDMEVLLTETWWQFGNYGKTQGIQ